MKSINKFLGEHYGIIALFAVKIIFYYIMIDLSPINGLVGGFTLIYLTVIFYACYTSEYKYRGAIFTALYMVVTVLMFVDTVYFSYFNQVTSINQIWQMNSLIVVDESVKFTTPPISVLLFLDVPFLIRYFRKSKARSVSRGTKTLYKLNVVALIIFFMIIFAINPVQADVIKKVNHTEFFTYHVKDIIANTFSGLLEDAKPVDEVIETIKDNVNSEEVIYLQGVAEGKNLIVIQIESFQNFVINREYNGQVITPNLNELLTKDTLYFDRYYQTIGKGNTADAELATQNSLYPVVQGESYRLYEQNTFHGLPWLMREHGYSTVVFHGYKGEFWNRENAYVNQGWEDFISLEDLEATEMIGFGLSDKAMFDQTVDYLEDMKTPFYSFIITLTNHHPYQLPQIYDEFELKEVDQDTIFGNYLRSVHYTDQAIGAFIEDLKEKGLYEDTVIALYGDHHGLNCKDELIYDQMTDFLGYDYNYDEMMRIPLIIHMPDLGESRTIKTVGGQVDFYPTLANLYGYEIIHPFIFGRDLINAEEGFVASLTYMLKGSFIKDHIIFEVSRDGLFENSTAWDLNTSEPLDVSELKDDYERANALIEESEYVLDNNLIQAFYQEEK